MAEKYLSIDFQQNFNLAALEEARKKELLKRAQEKQEFEKKEFEKLWATINADFNGEYVDHKFPGSYDVPVGYAGLFSNKILTEKGLGNNNGIKILVSRNDDNLLFVNGPNSAYDLQDKISYHRLFTLREQFKENRLKVLMPQIENLIRYQHNKIVVLKDDITLLEDINETLLKYGYKISSEIVSHEHFGVDDRTDYLFILSKL